MSALDGGSAFPVPKRRRDRTEDERLAMLEAYPGVKGSEWEFACMVEAEPGMTLRDYFAGRALAGLNADSNVTFASMGALAKCCYQQADAMIAERMKPPARGEAG